MGIRTWFLSRVQKIPPQPLEQLDPDLLTSPERALVVRARIEAGLKPWPSRDDDHYFNTIIGKCRECGAEIYGGIASSERWLPGGEHFSLCEKHMNRVP